MTELWRMGAGELAGAIRRRDVSSREVVQAHLARIEAANERLNAVTVVLAETALSAADATDQAIRTSDPLGPLCGVPITVKENIDVAGSATTQGVAAFRDAAPRRDAPHIAQLRAAGAIPIARTNMPEFGMRWHTDNALRGATRNPWDGTWTPGGSSGGDAVAVAAGMSPLGIGNDGAGSLRWPAQCCGVAALKPSHGRVPVSGGATPFAFQLLAVHGPIARRVEDLRLALQAMCGPVHSGDPWHAPAPFDGPPPPTPIRVTMVEDPGGLGVDRDIAAAVRRAGELLGQAGYVVEAGDAPALERVSETYFQTMERFGRLEEAATPPPGFLSADFERLWRQFNAPWIAAGGTPMADPMKARAGLYAAWSAMMRKAPLVLAPIATAPPWTIGADLEPDWGEAWIMALRMVVAPNLLGLPSVAVPVGVAGGRPQVVQIIGPRFREDLCLAAAEAIEAAIPALTPIEPR
ncbi:amidase [uncultured Phenylobacterium sp.]|uniref:amidase n=1 Tax=uncultured Phenylobacterium sp. TaxID=349273 RepID=UPI0025D0311B|nr:amidase [uncultured Phenylobacterium sp.]